MSGIDPRYPAAFQRGYEGGAPDPSASRVPSPSATAPPPAGRQTIDGKPGEQSLPEPQRNPFVVALWVVSIALIAGGVAAIVWSQQAMFGGFMGQAPQLGLIAAQAAYIAAGPCLQAGLIGVIALLVWHARAWQRRASGTHPRA